MYCNNTCQNIRKSILVTLFFILYSVLVAQTSYVGYENLRNKAEIQNGNNQLSEELLENIKYPVQLQYLPDVTILIACIEISPDGKVLRVFSLNPKADLYLLEFDRIIRSLDIKWISPNSDTCYYVQPIEFRTVPESEYETDYYFKPEYIHDPVVCLSNFHADNFTSDKEHVNRYEEYLKKRKYSRAMEELDLLINRNPFKEIFYIKKERLYTYMGKIDEAIQVENKIKILFQ